MQSYRLEIIRYLEIVSVCRWIFFSPIFEGKNPESKKHLFVNLIKIVSLCVPVPVSAPVCGCIVSGVVRTQTRMHSNQEQLKRTTQLASYTFTRSVTQDTAHHNEHIAQLKNNKN